MTKKKRPQEDVRRFCDSRRAFLKASAFVTLCAGSGLLARRGSAETVPPEPANLDEPTPLQEGDPAPVEMTVPAREPEQTSAEAPPSQPIDDVRPAQPGPNYVWVAGYWWWTGGRYVWVPGYWAVPPQAEYVYVPGYWTYRGTTWVYVRGGWGRPRTNVVVAYPDPRPAVTAFVVTAPIRIARRHRRWNYYYDRRRHHRAVRRTSPPGRSPARRPAPPARRSGPPRR